MNLEEMKEKAKKREHRFSLTLFLAFIVFIVLLVALSITALFVYLLIRWDIITSINGEVDFGELLLFMSATPFRRLVISLYKAHVTWKKYSKKGGSYTLKKFFSFWKKLPEDTRRDLIIMSVSLALLLGALLALIKYVIQMGALPRTSSGLYLFFSFL